METKRNYKALVIPFIVLLAVLVIDQLVKIYIKTHFFLGEEVKVLGDWFRLHFTENYGMAFGLEFGPHLELQLSFLFAGICSKLHAKKLIRYTLFHGL